VPAPIFLQKRTGIDNWSTLFSKLNSGKCSAPKQDEMKLLNKVEIKI